MSKYRVVRRHGDPRPRGEKCGMCQDYLKPEDACAYCPLDRPGPQHHTVSLPIGDWDLIHCTLEGVYDDPRNPRPVPWEQFRFRELPVERVTGEPFDGFEMYDLFLSRKAITEILRAMVNYQLQLELDWLLFDQPIRKEEMEDYMFIRDQRAQVASIIQQLITQFKQANREYWVPQL